MSNLEEFKKADTECHNLINGMSNVGVALSNTAYNFTVLNVMLSLYLPVITKSLAVIADKMSEEEKED